MQLLWMSEVLQASSEMQNLIIFLYQFVDSPSDNFLQAICCFPMLYYIVGSVSR